MLSPRNILAQSAATLLGLLAICGLTSAQSPQSSSSGGIFGQQRNQPTVQSTSQAASGQWRATRSTTTGQKAARPTAYLGNQQAAYRTMAEPVAMEPDVEGEYLVDGEFAADEGQIVHEGGAVSAEMFNYGHRPHWMDNLWLFAGATGFKGPIDQGQNGNFGFHEGANYGVPLFYDRPLSAQVGVRFSQSNFSGSELSDESRHQMFFTAGLFRRVQHGWQLGAAFDWLKDDFYAELDVHQIRGELSWVSVCGNELGVMAAISSADDQGEDGAATLNEFYEVADQFTVFLRIPLDRGGDGRIFAGATSDRDGIIGGELNVPINDRWSIQTAATYLIPEESSNATVDVPGHVGEIWGLSIALVWYPGCPVEGYNPFKPLFNVADNTSMLVERRGN